jgi:DNA mismatch repair ATPase MutL
MVDYRVRTNTYNKCSKTTQEKTKQKKQKNKQKKTTKKQKQQNTKKSGSLHVFTLIHELLIILLHLETAFAAETLLAEEQWLKEQLTTVKLRTSQIGTRIPTFTRTEGQ